MLTRVSRLGREESGFTLIELLVVVAIIALLTAFAVPKLFDAVSKSKDARGQGDMETIPSAFDRFYFDKDQFPVPTVNDPAGSVKAALMPAYLKNTTKYVNGYNRGYMYITNATGGFYIVIDPKNLAEGTAVDVTCESVTETAIVGHDLTVVTAATLTASNVAKGCAITDPAGGLPFVTN